MLAQHKKTQSFAALFWILLTTTTKAFAITPQPAGTNLTSYPIKWIQGSLSVESFTRVEGLSISNNDTYYNLIADKTCTCNSACWAHPPCVAVSSEKSSNGKILCRLTKKSPMNSDLMINPDAVYSYKKSSIPSLFHGIGLDGLLYVIPNTQYIISYIKDICARIPGHRLGMFHTEQQFRALMDIHAKAGFNRQLNIDLRDFNDVDPEWGDGTKASATSAWSAISAAWNSTRRSDLQWMVVNGNQLFDAANWYGYTYAVCQANPLGITW